MKITMFVLKMKGLNKLTFVYSDGMSQSTRSGIFLTLSTMGEDIFIL